MANSNLIESAFHFLTRKLIAPGLAWIENTEIERIGQMVLDVTIVLRMMYLNLDFLF